jgi:peptide/nickel transport system substrate-binding protein
MLIRRLIAGLIVLGLASLVPGPSSAETKVLRVVPHADLTQLDPVFASIVITREYGLMIYEELFAWNSKLQPKPQMVESWNTSPDGLTWHFTLRDGLKFHDGQPVTTADVIASLKRWMGRDLVGAKVLAVLASLDPVDAKTLELRLKKPYPNLLFSLGSAIGQIPIIMRAKDLEGDPSKPVTTSIGSGPFKFNREARVSGALTVFDRNPDYVPRAEPADGLSGGRLAKVDRVEWRVIPDAATAAAALQNGEVDIWEQPALDLVPLLSQKPGVRMQRLTELSNQTMLRPNSLYPPFNDPKARLALAYIVNQVDVMAAGFGDERFWRQCNAYYVCGGPYGTEVGTEDFKPDIAKAKALLAEAGYHGEKLVFPSTHEIAWIGHMAEVVADEMKQAGMDVDIIWADWGTTAGRQANQNPPSAGGWNMFVTGASGVTMHHPLTNLGTNMSCDRKNFAGWPCDEHAEGLRQAFLDVSDADKPVALDNLHRYLAQVQPYRVLGQYDQPVALRANVAGLLSSPVIVYWNIDKQ